ncbi:hypothetical protein [Rhizobium alvei]|uniref:Uncharacterized protein n=1 Tax=Rhizobium alvei TaxID=1132659 RepID=A0ABT8YSC3_9HYPH|nr:hypothetical protein [Rhizobium alvei]MDO6966527.1 hypothetical protein [Rhizobium alvei]
MTDESAGQFEEPDGPAAPQLLQDLFPAWRFDIPAPSRLLPDVAKIRQAQFSLLEAGFFLSRRWLG